jgi:hypothetical protein
MDISKMTDEEIYRQWVWTPRLIFNANLLYGKKLKDVTNEELLEVKKYSLEQQHNSKNK